MRKVTRADHVKFHKLRAQYVELIALRDTYGSALDSKYQKAQWASKTEKDKLASLDKKVDTVRERFNALLEAISPRDWSRGIPFNWPVHELSWSDAITDGALSIRPPPAYGYSDRELDSFVARPNR